MPEEVEPRYGTQLREIWNNTNGTLGWQHVWGDVDNKSTMRFAAGTTNFNAFGPPRTGNCTVSSGFKRSALFCVSRFTHHGDRPQNV